MCPSWTQSLGQLLCGFRCVQVGHKVWGSHFADSEFEPFPQSQSPRFTSLLTLGKPLLRVLIFEKSLSDRVLVFKTSLSFSY